MVRCGARSLPAGLRVTAETLGTTLVSMRAQGLVDEVGEGAEAPKRAVHISEYGREALDQAIRLEDQEPYG